MHLLSKKSNKKLLLEHKEFQSSDIFLIERSFFTK
uniref:Uncharacterized protein n=1 Tax=Rhizophora mucronata TaxID=61149 RepID=A0A2P2NDC0_RHIMU